MKENLYTYSEIQRNCYASEIARKAVVMFCQGYTLRTISKTLCGAYSFFTKDDIRSIIGKSLTDFIREENQHCCAT